MVSCQKGPTRHAYAWQIGPFWQDTLDIYNASVADTYLWWAEDISVKSSQSRMSADVLPPFIARSSLDLTQTFHHLQIIIVFLGEWFVWWISSQNEFKSWFMTSMHIQFLSNTSMIHNLQSRSQHPIAIFKWVMLGSWGILRGPVARICILEGCSVSSLMNLTLLTRTFSALPIFKADFYLNRRNGINNLLAYRCQSYTSIQLRLDSLPSAGTTWL